MHSLSVVISLVSLVDLSSINGDGEFSVLFALQTGESSSSPNKQRLGGCVNPQPLVKDQGSWSPSCISFPPGDESDKARTVQPSSYLPCDGPPPLYSSLLAPVHTGCRTGLPQAWAAQLSRSPTSVTYLNFIGHRPRGQFSTNRGRNSIHCTLCAPIQMLRPTHYTVFLL